MRSESISVFFYVQHLLGIGHLMRAGRIARALQNSNIKVTLVTGGLPVEGFNTSGLNPVELPPMAVRDGNFSMLVDEHDNPVDDAFKALRCQALLEAYHAVQPDIVILEAYPFGRRQVQFELTPLIEAIETTDPKPVLVCSVRDILQKRYKPGRAEQSASLVELHFDKVLVHGDPAFVSLDESFPCAAQIAEQIIYTGVVCGPSPQKISQPVDIVVSAGGGAVGAKLLEATVEAATLLPEIGKWCVITGPNLANDDFMRIAESAPPNVELKRFVVDFPSLLCSTDLSISQAGYNTVSDVLQAGCRSILVPYGQHGETEQSDRAARLQRLGLAKVLSEDSLSGASIAAAIRDAMAQSAPAGSTSINTDGANATAKILAQLVALKGYR